jgi:hypothetical protein
MTRKALAHELGISRWTLWRYIRAIETVRPCDLEAEASTIREAVRAGINPRHVAKVATPKP